MDVEKQKYMEKRIALIIDKEIEFCMLVGTYLSRKNIDAYYTETIAEGLEIIELKRPDIIIADKALQDIANSLHTIIDATSNYDPDVFLVDFSSFRKEGSIMDEINKLIKRTKDKF